MSGESKLVYSSAAPGQRLDRVVEEQPIQAVEPSLCPLVLKVEKKGRGGKEVTLVLGLPHNPDYAQGLLKELKKKLGAGGTLKDGQLEIQGNRLKPLAELLAKKGFPLKGSGLS